MSRRASSAASRPSGSGVDPSSTLTKIVITTIGTVCQKATSMVATGNSSLGMGSFDDQAAVAHQRAGAAVERLGEEVDHHHPADQVDGEGVDVGTAALDQHLEHEVVHAEPHGRLQVAPEPAQERPLVAGLDGAADQQAQQVAPPEDLEQPVVVAGRDQRWQRGRGSGDGYRSSAPSSQGANVFSHSSGEVISESAERYCSARSSHSAASRRWIATVRLRRSANLARSRR